ncbi:MAG: hypothetical protein M0006_10510 [Magnetospirillum sp.]|nr:hypothetical protein [Magnetospirillum sp.]
MVAVGSIIVTAQGLARVIAIERTPVVVGSNALNNALARTLGGQAQGTGGPVAPGALSTQAAITESTAVPGLPSQDGGTQDGGVQGSTVVAQAVFQAIPGAAAKPAPASASKPTAAQQAALAQQGKAFNAGLGRNVVDFYLSAANASVPARLVQDPAASDSFAFGSSPANPNPLSQTPLLQSDINGTLYTVLGAPSNALAVASLMESVAVSSAYLSTAQLDLAYPPPASLVVIA